MTDLPRVSVWEDAGTEWRVVTDLPVYSSLSCEPRFNDSGPWQLTVPGDAASDVVDTEHLVTFDWRGIRLMTGVIVGHEDADDEESGNPVLNLSGLDALAYVGYSLAWPQPTLGIASQTLWDPNAPPPIRAVADSAVLTLIRNNLVGRRTQNVTVAASHDVGSTLSVRPAFDNLLELALRKATRGGIGLKATIEGVQDVNSTVGALTVRAYQPIDRSVQIVFDSAEGTASSWSWRRTAPSASRAIVSGVQGKYRSVARAATGWNPPREQFVQGPASYDDDELDQAADESLDAGRPAVDVSLTATETPSQQAFTHYNVGDTATARRRSRTLVDTISAIGVKVDESGPVVTPVFGDPDGIDPRDAHAKLLRRTRRDVDQQKRRT